MTTFTYNALVVLRDSSGAVTSIGSGTAGLVVAPGVTGLSYTASAPPSGTFPIANFDPAEMYRPLFNGAPIVESAEQTTTFRIGQHVHSGGLVTQLLVLHTQQASGASRSVIVQLGGAPLPAFGSVADFTNYISALTSSGQVPSGPFAPGSTFGLGSLPGLVGTTENDLIFGWPTNDTLSGGIGNDTIHGEGGDDRIFGGPGDDRLFGGAGNDTIFGGPGADTIDGGAGDDQINPGRAPGAFGSGNFIFGSAGNDTIDFGDVQKGDGFTYLNYRLLGAPITVTINGPANTGTIAKAGQGIDTLVNVNRQLDADANGLNIEGTPGSDSFTVNGGAETFVNLFPGAGSDSFNITLSGVVRIVLGGGGATSAASANIAAGTISNDGFGTSDTITVTGGSGRLELEGTDFADTLIGSIHNDAFLPRGGNDTLNGGAGFDMVRYDRPGMTSAVSVDLAAGIATGSWDGTGFAHTLISIERVWGTGRNDVIRGSAANERLEGRGGNDTLDGRGGNDTLLGGDGDDLLIGGAGNDFLDGGAGFDRAQFNVASTSVTVTGDANEVVIASTEGQDTVRGVESFIFTDATLTLAQVLALVGGGGGAGLDLTGTPGPDTLDGGPGGDVIRGLGGNDLIRGFAGNDTLYGGDGADTIIGGDGDDLIFGGDTEADVRDVIYGGAGNDTIDGGHGNDELRGDAGDDVLIGGFGADTLIGGEGNDRLDGGALGDVLFGGPGNDFLNGGFGFDRLNGGAGADTFFHLGVAGHGSDWIQDYNAAEGDVLQTGIAGAVKANFQINIATTPGAGSATVAEAFVIYRPTGQILFALVDGAGQSSINMILGGQVVDLLA
ncbi:MAG: calcium-binding protein [Gemmobacter sp.]